MGTLQASGLVPMVDLEIQQEIGGGAMITRNEKGKLQISRLDLGVAMDGFFIMAQPKNKEEAEWLYEQLQDYLEQSYEDTIADFDEEG